MKKYYCPSCGELKSRIQLKRKDDTRVAFYECRYCHSSKIYLTKDIIQILANKIDFNEVYTGRHGSFL